MPATPRTPHYPGGRLPVGKCLDNVGTLRDCAFPLPTGTDSGPAPNSWRRSSRCPGSARSHAAGEHHRSQPWKGRSKRSLTGSSTGFIRNPRGRETAGRGVRHQRWNEFHPQEFFKTPLRGRARTTDSVTPSSGTGTRRRIRPRRALPHGLRTNDNAAILVGQRRASRSGSTRTCPSRTRRPSGPSTGRSAKLLVAPPGSRS